MGSAKETEEVLAKEKESGSRKHSVQSNFEGEETIHMTDFSSSEISSIHLFEITTATTLSLSDQTINEKETEVLRSTEKGSGSRKQSVKSNLSEKETEVVLATGKESGSRKLSVE